VPDLVEEERAAVGGLEQAGARGLGVGEGAALVAEQLGLDQVLGQRGAVHLDERAVPPPPGDAQRARDVAESQWKAARLQFESASAGGTERRLDEAALAQARANLRAAQAKLEQTTIEAPVDGTLIARNVERGNVVQPGKALMVLSPAGDTQLVVQIDEKNLNLLRIGQEALASADAYPAERFAARVAYVNPAVDPLRGSVEVKLAVPRPPAYLLQDMTVSVDVEVARRDSVLLLPADAIHDLASTAPWVLAVRSGRIERQDVKLGARGEGRVEILAGLAEGEHVVPSTRAGLGEGKPAHVKAPKAARNP
jgi:HlyD family secretion protein